MRCSIRSPIRCSSRRRSRSPLHVRRSGGSAPWRNPSAPRPAGGLPPVCAREGRERAPVLADTTGPGDRGRRAWPPAGEPRPCDGGGLASRDRAGDRSGTRTWSSPFAERTRLARTWVRLLGSRPAGPPCASGRRQGDGWRTGHRAGALAVTLHAGRRDGGGRTAQNLVGACDSVPTPEGDASA